MHSPNEMARAGCTTLRGVRHWEDFGLLGSVERTEGGTRRYTAEQMDKAKIIAAARFGGWSLEEISEMLAEWGPETYEAISQRLTIQVRAGIRLIEELPKPSAMRKFDL